VIFTSPTKIIQKIRKEKQETEEERRNLIPRKVDMIRINKNHRGRDDT
jgi:hypothetical protein